MRNIIHIVYALRFYLAMAVVVWWVFPASREVPSYRIFRATAAAVELTAEETERVLQQFGNASIHRVSRTFSHDSRAGGRRPN